MWSWKSWRIDGMESYFKVDGIGVQTDIKGWITPWKERTVILNHEDK
jgi:hypothetical protein